MQLCDEIIKLYTNGYLRLFRLKCSVSGAYPLPEGPKIIAANHPNVTDSYHLVSLLQDKPHFLMRSKLFSKPIIGWLLRKAGQIEVTDFGRSAFQQACKLLQQGRTIVIYPEGRLNPESKKLKAKSGAIRLSLATGAPIVPLGLYVPLVYIKDMRSYLNGRLSQGSWQVSGICYLKFGCPWTPNFSGEDPLRIHSLSQEMMDNIHALVDELRKEVTCESLTSLSPIPQW